MMMSPPAEPTLRLTVLGQALIQHDLRVEPWRGLPLVSGVLAGADACFTNLETALRTPLAGAPTREDVFLHAADPVVLDCLRDFGVSLLATAGNHAGDLGTGGILGMVAELEQRGFAHAGAGSDLAAAAAPGYCRTPAGTIALVAAASGAIRDGAAASAARPGVNELRCCAAGSPEPDDLSRILGAITQAGARADLVLAYHHNHRLEAGGRQTPEWQRTFARQCIDAGAALYVSHGAPRLHGVELYRGCPIFYDLGNFVFQTATEEGFYDDAVWDGVIAECRFALGRFRAAVLTPIVLDPRGVHGRTDFTTRGRPSIADSERAAAILDRLAELSCPFGTAFERTGNTAIIRAG